MQETDELVHQSEHAFLPREVGGEHLEVAEQRVLQRSGVFRLKDVGHEELHDAETHREEGHVVAGPEEGELVLGAALKRCGDQRQIAWRKII